MSQTIPLPMALPIRRQSRAVTAFGCIGSDCEDTCCGGMGVVIDRSTFEKYRACPDLALKEVMDREIVRDPQSTHDATYARITASRFCPFLTEERLCAIQQRLGAGYLSRTCDTYPHALTMIDGVQERSLYLSCPEAARRVLLSPDAMVWEEADGGPHLRPPISSLETTGTEASGKPYRHFYAIRGFIASLLRDRTYALWERLVILGMFSGQLDDMDDAEVPGLIASFREAVGDGQLRPSLAGVSSRADAQIDFLQQAFDYRLGSDFAAPRFVDSYWEFREGIGYAPEASATETANRYDTARDAYYAPFMAQHPHIMENDILNYVGRTQFPLGPQTGLYLEARTCADEFALLAIRCTLIRSLLVGMAGCHKQSFSSAHVVRAVQAFSKAIEHDLPYQKSLLRSLADHSLAELPFLAILLRD